MTVPTWVLVLPLLIAVVVAWLLFWRWAWKRYIEPPLDRLLWKWASR